MNEDHVHQVYYGEEGDDASRVLTRARIHWTVDHVPEGRILDIGCSQGVASVLLAERGEEVVGIDNEPPAIEFAAGIRERSDPEVRERLELFEADAAELPFEVGSFDHALCSEVLEHVEDPGRVIEEAFRVLRPGGTLVATVPFGVMPHPDHRRVFYPATLAALLEPMFSVEEEALLDRHVAVVAKRRKRSKGTPTFELTTNEKAYLNRESRLRDELDTAREKLHKANLKYRESTAATATYRDRLTAGEAAVDEAKKTAQRAEDEAHASKEKDEKLRTLKARVAELEGKVESGREQLEAATAEVSAGRAAERRRLREQRSRRRSKTAEQIERLAGLAEEHSDALDEIEGRLPEIGGDLDQAEAIARRGGYGEPVSIELPRPARPRPADEFDHWCARAAAAAGDEVVFMYSGTIYVQEKRGNRPIRLTRVYLEQERPVFFNYWRWKSEDPPPDYTHPLLYQSPVDMTPKLLDRLLEADFGDKRKMMFASFPHELMIRALSRGAQMGWTTIYDARDDWEEFEKVGMAKWYDRGFEEYLVRQADVVTAVSEPLARKLVEMGDRDDIEVVPNALDSHFPSPSGPREVSDPPVVGYFGHLTAKWFDWDLVIRAAGEHPGWTFELAGHQEPEDLELPENVILLGLLGHAELAELSRRWSFAIIPFKVSALGEAVDPIKVYEYLHLNLPVLSSYMPQMRDYPATVIAESSEDFLTLLPSMIELRLDPDVVRPWLAMNRWEDRVDHFSRLARRAQERHRESHGLGSLLSSIPEAAEPGRASFSPAESR